MPLSASAERARGVPLAFAIPVGSLANPASMDCEHQSKMQDDGRPGLVTEVSACTRQSLKVKPSALQTFIQTKRSAESVENQFVMS